MARCLQGGYLRFTAGHQGAFGNIGGAEDFCSVSAGATARFQCDVALNTGATYVSQGGTIIDFEWDPTSSQWVDADWQKGRLELTYTVTPGGPMSPPTFAFEFDDSVTKSVPWDPAAGAFGASLEPGSRDGEFVWDLVFKSAVAPDPDLPRSSSGPDTVYPYWVHFVEDAAAQTGDGVMLIDGTAGHGTLVGMEAVRASTAVAGYYRVRDAAAPFRVFNGRLHIGDDMVPVSRVHGSTLRWSGLSPEQQEHSGLPEAGSIEFTLDGSSNAHIDGPIAARLDATDAVAAVASIGDPDTELQLATSLAEDEDASNLTIIGLMEMNPYVQDPKSGQWGDAVQAAVTNDLSTIMNSFIPADMWNLVLPGQSQPVLSGELATVAHLPVQGVTDPTAFYKGVATAVLTSGMATGSDPACAELNGPRASQWLKTQIAVSNVYYTHGQALFQYEWGQRFAATSQYLSDQITNATTYATTIDQQVQLSITDINNNVVADAGSDPNLKADLIADVTAAGQYAKTNNLYWAYYYYTYNTSAAILANIAMAMSVGNGASDGTVLSRMLQQNTSVLTAIDASGYFAKLYTKTLNTFLAVNILPSMFSFGDDASSYDLIKQYLEMLVANNLSNQNAQIAAAAAELQQILASQDADQMLHDSIEALRDLAGSIQDILALPYIANGFVTWFSQTYPRMSFAANIFGTAMIAGLSGMAMFNIVTDFKRWDDLTAAEKTQLVAETAQFGIQVLSAVVVRGVRIYAIFSVDGLTLAQRSAAISKALAGFDSDVVDQGLLKISNTFARYLGDTAGTAGRLAVMDDVGIAAVMVGDAEEVSFMAAVIGKNLTEFVATSVGAVFVLAGIGVSIWSIIDGDGGLALAGDILNIVSGALTLFAVVGGFLVTSGVIAAESILVPLIAAAGPLGILLALAGIGIALYLLFRKPPDPVQQFVTKYAAPVGLALPAKASSIDYITRYANPDQQQLLMCGAQLRAGAQALSVAGSGAITLATPTALPDSVWQWVTDGLGLTQVCTIVEPAGKTSPIAVLLSLMSDGSVSFQPPMAGQSPSQGQPTILTQRWLFAAMGHASLTSNGAYLTSLSVHAQPVKPDASGNYSPQNASGYLATSGTGVTVTPTGSTTFNVVMSGLAPNYMAMRDITFITGTTPDQSQIFAPVFGIAPSTPTSYASSGTLPCFLAFNSANGSYKPTGGAATAPETDHVTVSATNPLGAAPAPFTIEVGASTGAVHAAIEQTLVGAAVTNGN